MRILCFLLICAALMNVLPASAEDKADYASDFSAGTDGWYPRSMGGASLDVTEDGALRITGRSADGHSPGRDFPLAAGESYRLRVLVRQNELNEARMVLSVAHSKAGVESYENLAFASAPPRTSPAPSTASCCTWRPSARRSSTLRSRSLHWKARPFHSARRICRA